MKQKIISVSHAKAKLLELMRRVHEDGQAFLLTKDGKPVGALVPMEEYEALLETADILIDTEAFKDLEAALEDERNGRVYKRDSKGKWSKAKGKSKAA